MYRLLLRTLALRTRIGRGEFGKEVDRAIRGHHLGEEGEKLQFQQAAVFCAILSEIRWKFAFAHDNHTWLFSYPVTALESPPACSLSFTLGLDMDRPSIFTLVAHLQLTSNPGTEHHGGRPEGVENPTSEQVNVSGNCQ